MLPERGLQHGAKVSDVVTVQCNVSIVLMTTLLHHVQYSIGAVVMAAVLCHDEDTRGYQQALLLCRNALQMPDLYTTS